MRSWAWARCALAFKSRLSADLSRFVGRHQELEQLKRALTLAREGHGQIVAAVAEAGVGKSRLFHEFKLMSQSDTFVMEAFSVSHGRASAYLPVIELLKSYFRIDDQDDERTQREKITGRMLALDRALAGGDAVPVRCYSACKTAEARSTRWIPRSGAAARATRSRA